MKQKKQNTTKYKKGISVLMAFLLMLTSSILSFIEPIIAEAVDTTPPTITEYIFINPNNNGSNAINGNFKVRIKVNDPSGISKVASAAFTTANGQDDLNPNWETQELATYIGNGTWEYTVDLSKHNFEEGQYTVHTYVWDNAGNKTGVGGAFFINVDLVKPTISNPVSVKGFLVNTRTYKVQVTATDASAGIWKVSFPTWTLANSQDDLNPNYQTEELGTYIGNNTWEYTVEVSKHNNEEGLYRTHIYVWDLAGNRQSSIALPDVMVDLTAPTAPILFQNVNIPTNQNVSVSVTYPSDALTKQYRVNGGAWISYMTGVIMTANGTVEARGIDEAGNISTIESLNVANIDKTPPATATFSPSTTATTNQDVSVTLHFPADAVTKQYKISSGGAWTSYTTPVVLSSNNTVYARSYDAVGNLSNETNLVVNNIDKVAPTTPTLSADVTAPTNGNVLLTASFSTDSSVKEYRLNGGAWTAYTTAVTMTSNGKMEVRATDNAGNVSAIGVYDVTNIDKVAPANATLTPSTTAPTNNDVSVTIGYPADATVKQYKIGSAGTWTTYTAPVVLSANNTVYARSYDAVGNLSNETSLVVNNIDKVAPTTPTLSADVTSPTNGNVVVTATFPADAYVKEYRLNGGAWTAYTTSVPMTANGTFEARAKDVAGNYSAVGSYAISNIDKTAPANATFVADKTVPTNSNVTVTINYPADASVKQYKVGTAGTWTSYAVPVSVSNNETVYARSYDAVGNLSAESNYVVSNIDKVAPITPTLSVDVTSPTNGNVVLNASFPTDAFVKEYRVNGGIWTAYTAPITFTANGKVEVRATDNAGNASIIGSYDITNIDKTAPANATLSASTTAPTNQNVNVTISYPADASVKQYRIESSGTWTAYTTPVVLSSNNTVYARSTDAVGNVSNETSLVINNIDKVAPTAPNVSADVTIPTNGNVVLTASFPGDASMKEYRLNGGIWIAYSAPVTMTVNGKMEVRATDNAGNISSITSYDVTNIDKMAPANATLTPSTTAPTNEDVTVTIAYPADATVKQYKSGSTGTWTTYATPVVVSANTTVYARSYDAVGNVSAESNYTVTNIDKVAPTTPTLSADVTSQTNGNVVVTASFPADVSVKEYRLNGGSWTAYSTPINMTANGKVEVRATDNAGNVSAIGIYDVTNIDKTAPASASFNADKTAPTNTDVTVTITYPSDASVKQYKIGSTGTWTAYTAPLVVSSNTTVFSRSFDAVGNLSSESNYAVTNIDKVAPITPTLSADVTAPTNGNVVLTASFPADASVKEYRLNGGTWTSYTAPVVLTSNGKLEARATDNAGNVSTIGTFDVNNIDKTAPVNATLSADQTAPTNGNVIVTIAYPSDATVKQYKVGATGTWTAYTTPVVLLANNTVFARSFDAVGNLSAETSYAVTNIDKTAPITPTVSADVTIPTNGDVTVSASYPTDASVKEYRLNGGTWTAYTTPVKMTANGTFEARAKDVAGNYSSFGTYTVTNIDRVAPVKPVLSADKTNPTNTSVVVTAQFANDVTKKEYRKDGGLWTLYTAPIAFSDNGKLEIRGADEAGNVSEIASYDVNNIDKVAPNAPVSTSSKTTPTNQDVSVSVTFSADSVVKQVRKDNGVWVDYTSPVVFSDNGKLEARSYDNAGNVSSVTTLQVTNIDKVKPNVATFTADQTAPTNKDVALTVSFPADAVKKEVRVNSGEWTVYTSSISFSANGKIEARSTDNAGNISDLSSYQVSNIDKVAPQNPTHSAQNNSNTIVLSGEAESTLFYQLDGSSWTKYTDKIVTSDGTHQLSFKAVDPAGNESEGVTATELMYRDALKEAESKVDLAETNITQENVDVSYAKVDLVPHNASEYQPLIDRLDDLQDVLDAKVALEEALNSRNQQDVEDAKLKIDLLDSTNPVIIDILDEIEAELEVADILALVAKERNDILSSKYGMSKVAYDSLVQSYYAIKYTGDSMYKMASEKISLVPDADKYYNLAHEQYNNLNIDYDQFVEDRIATDAEIKAESSVKAMESKYDPTISIHTQELINAVKDTTVRANLQKRLDTAKANYEASQIDKASQDARLAVEKAESTKQTYYVSEAYKKVNALTNESLKVELTNSLNALEAQMALDRQIADATRTVELAEQYKYQSYIDSAQNKVNALPTGEAKTSLQQRLDTVKAGLPTSDQATIIKQATNYVSLAQSLKTQYYVDKAQGYVNQIMDEAKKAELQAKLDAIAVVK